MRATSQKPGRLQGTDLPLTTASGIWHLSRSDFNENLVGVLALPPFAKCAKDGAPSRHLTPNQSSRRSASGQSDVCARERRENPTTLALFARVVRFSRRATLCWLFTG